jgi:hypothetical protein
VPGFGALAIMTNVQSPPRVPTLAWLEDSISDCRSDLTPAAACQPVDGENNNALCG